MSSQYFLLAATALYFAAQTEVEATARNYQSYARFRRQAARPPVTEAVLEPEGRMLDPAFLSMMFSAAGLPGMGASAMSNGFSSVCSYPFIYYSYYQYCMGMGGSGMNNGVQDMFPYNTGPNSPGFGMSPSSNFPMFSPASNGVDIGGPNGFGPNSFNNPSFNGQFMNPYAWASGPSDPSGPGNPASGAANAGLLPFNQENSQPASSGINPNLGNPAGNPGSSSPVLPVPNSPPFQRGGIPSQRGSPMTVESPVMGFIPPEFMRRPPIYQQPQMNVFPMQLPPGLPAIILTKMFGPLIDERPSVLNGTGNNTPVDIPSLPRETIREPSLSNTNISEVSSVFLPSIAINTDTSGYFPHEKRRIQKMAKKLSAKSSSVQNVKDFEKYLAFAFELINGLEKGKKANSATNDLLTATTTTTPDQIFINTQLKADQAIILEAFNNSTQTDQVKCIEKYFCTASADLTGGNRSLAMEVLEVIRPVAARLLEPKIPAVEWDISAGIDSGRQGKQRCEQIQCQTT